MDTSLVDQLCRQFSSKLEHRNTGVTVAVPLRQLYSEDQTLIDYVRRADASIFEMFPEYLDGLSTN